MHDLTVPSLQTPIKEFNDIILFQIDNSPFKMSLMLTMGPSFDIAIA